MAYPYRTSPLSKRQEWIAAMAATNDCHIRVAEQQATHAREMIETVRVMVERAMKMRRRGAAPDRLAVREGRETATGRLSRAIHSMRIESQKPHPVAKTRRG
jgi:hypothetical protein